MTLVVVGLVALVIYLGRKAPANPNTGGTVVGPDPMISATGANWVQSPASSNGSPLINNQNGIRVATTYQNAQSAPGKIVSAQVPNRTWARTRQAMDNSADYLTDANNSLMTQDIPPIVQQTNNQTVGTKL